MKGILLIAIGTPFYKEMAYNMALSLRKSDNTIPIAVVTDEPKYFSEQQKSLFKFVIPIDENDTLEDYLMNPFMVKTRINDLTPFDETLYLDSDGLFNWKTHSLTELFEKLQPLTFQMHEVARYNKDTAKTAGMIWYKISEAWDAFHLKDTDIYPETNSSFIYWKKSEANTEFFNEVKKNYFERPLKFTQIGKAYPDELAWNITCAKMNFQGGIEGFRPVYFDYERGVVGLEEIEKEFYFIGLAGGYIKSRVVTFYNNLAKQLRADSGDSRQFEFKLLEKIFHRK